MVCAYAAPRMVAPRMSQSVCFVLPGLGPSGGVRAVLNHARLLARDHGLFVTVALPAAAGERPPPDVRVVTYHEARGEAFDIAVATWWQTVGPMFAIPASDAPTSCRTSKNASTTAEISSGLLLRLRTTCR